MTTESQRAENRLREIKSIINWLSSKKLEDLHRGATTPLFPGYSTQERVSGGGVEWRDPTGAVAIEDRKFKLDPECERADFLLFRIRGDTEELAELLGFDLKWRLCTECGVKGPVVKGLCANDYAKQYRKKPKKIAA